MTGPANVQDVRREVLAHQLPEGGELQHRRVGRLVGRARTAGRHLFGDARRVELRDAPESAALLDGLSPRARARIWRAAAPNVADALEWVWQDGLDAAYPMGPNRRAMRAPGNPAVTAAGRLQRVQRLGWWACRWDQPVTWLANHGGHADPGGTGAHLYAAVLRHGPEHEAALVRSHLVDQLHGRGVPGAMGRHAPKALLLSDDPDLWAEVEALLLGAQRQEGVRQTILEAVDRAHPDAFSRLVGAIAEHGLTRFAATARAVGVWLGEPFEARDRKLLDDLLGNAAPLLASAQDAAAATRDPDPGIVRLGLWASGTRNAVTSAGLARRVLAEGDPDHRVVAAGHLADVGPVVDHQGILTALGDDDERVRTVAFGAVRQWSWSGGPVGETVLDALLALHERTPKAVEVPLGTWKPSPATLDPRDIADATVGHLGDRSPTSLRALVRAMSPHGRALWAQALAKEPRSHRSDLLELIGDRAEHPRRVALEALERTTLAADEAPALEALLTRQSADLRRGVLTLLLSLPDDAAVASARRLVDGKKHQVRAGRELANELVKARRGGDQAKALAEHAAPVGAATPATPAAANTLSAEAAPRVPVTRLVDHGRRTSAARPELPAPGCLAAAAPRAALAITSIQAWLDEHADTEVRVRHNVGSDAMLLADVRWIGRLVGIRPWAEQASNIPLPDVVDPWWERTCANLDDASVAVGVAAAVLGTSGVGNPWAWRHTKEADPGWVADLLGSLPGIATAGATDDRPVAHGLLSWVAVRELTPGAIDAVLDVLDTVLASVPSKEVRRTPTAVDLARTNHVNRRVDWRDRAVVNGPARWATLLEGVRPDLWSPEQRARLVRALRWLDEPHGLQASPRLRAVRSAFRGLPERDVPDRPTRRPLPLRLACRAVEDGSADRADVVELLVGDRCPEDRQAGLAWDGNNQRPLSEATRRARPGDLAGFAWLPSLVDDVRDAMLDVELARGELPTAVTSRIGELRTVVGTDRVLQALTALGSQKFVRGYVWGGRDAKKDVLSKLVRVAFPGPQDTAEEFAQKAADARLRPNRLVDLAVYAPQWAPFVEVALERPGLADAVRWLHAHTKDTGWQVDADVRAEWGAQVMEQTALSAEDLVAGAVDVDWFQRVRATLGDEHFTSLLKAAKYASSAGGHKRAELFARALRGEVEVDALTERGDDKRHQDTVRAVGLVPLPQRPDDARAEVLRRWEWLQQWAKGSRQFGQQRRASEALAVRVATDNLARTAGYADPQRLTWAMEAEAVRDLAAGPLVATADDVTVTLSIDQDGAPTLGVERAGKRLKNVPRKVAKDEQIAQLKARAAALREQARRMRRSLEDAMVRGDAFTLDELDELAGHAVLRPMLERLLVVDDGGALARPDARGFVGPDGTDVSLVEPVQLAHPVDLLASGRWHDWQHTLFQEKVRQPCKQVFRELYVLTDAEREDGTRSSRWAGQQVQPSQASALFGARGWVVSPEGEALRTFHDQDVTAHVGVMLGVYGTPAEVEDTTIEEVSFTRRGSWEPLPLDQVPPRLFSEVMRDVDLVVSVAHAGGHDPETSASSVEVRSAIVRETAELLGLDNVELTDNHAMVRGQLGRYSIHLGSGTVHKRPGNAVCIIPVGSQHRGRIFLPFVDDDPGTAEVVSKVVLLARDHKISDPAILDQIR